VENGEQVVLNIDASNSVGLSKCSLHGEADRNTWIIYRLMDLVGVA
jgi:hypothetical protein